MVPCEVMMYYAGPLEDVYPGLKLTRISYSDTEVPMQEFPLIQGIQHVEGVRLAQASKIRARGVAAIGEHSYELSLIFPAPLHSALRGNLNRWASAMVEAGLSRRMFHDLLPVCQWRVVNVIHQTYLDRAKVIRS